MYFTHAKEQLCGKGCQCFSGSADHANQPTRKILHCLLALLQFSSRRMQILFPYSESFVNEN